MAEGQKKPKALYYGQLALKYRFVTPEQLAACLGAQEESMARGEKPRRLGEIMVDLGFITTAQAQMILEIQGRQGGHQEVSGYEVYSPIGSGGMGTVYRARQIATDRIVALKILLPKLARDTRFVRRFVREVRAAAMLDHPNIVHGLDVGESNGLFYFAMEFVEGTTLQKLLEREGSLDERRSLEIILQLADALAHAAERGIVHGDVKPANVLLERGTAPRLCDLGLARQANAASKEVAMGTPVYAAPEQVKGEKFLDSRADIYSLGATLYHMVTGRHPFYGTLTRVLLQTVREEVRPPSELNSRLSPACDRLIVRMLEKDPDRRQGSPKEVVDEIRSLLRSREFCRFDQLDPVTPPGPVSAPVPVAPPL
ncbi:MAG: protein kinase, partial [Candidatus Latescibacteria bacterium]|nr:protein kinase [Candidatus Latescibacterota bacterium]